MKQKHVSFKFNQTEEPPSPLLLPQEKISYPNQEHRTNISFRYQEHGIQDIPDGPRVDKVSEVKNKSMDILNTPRSDELNKQPDDWLSMVFNSSVENNSKLDSQMQGQQDDQLSNFQLEGRNDDNVSLSGAREQQGQTIQGMEAQAQPEQPYQEGQISRPMMTAAQQHSTPLIIDYFRSNSQFSDDQQFSPEGSELIQQTFHPSVDPLKNIGKTLKKLISSELLKDTVAFGICSTFLESREITRRKFKSYLTKNARQRGHTNIQTLVELYQLPMTLEGSLARQMDQVIACYFRHSISTGEFTNAIMRSKIQPQNKRSEMDFVRRYLYPHTNVTGVEHKLF